MTTATMERRPINILPLKGWEEITAFIRRQAASWGEMEDYLVDSGAVLTWIATK